VLRFVQGDATSPAGDEKKVIAHVVNDRGGWGKGFVLAISRRHPEAEAAYRRWSRRPAPDDPSFSLGQVQFVAVAPDRWTANMLAQHGYQAPDNPVPLDYAALECCLITLARFALSHGATVHMPRIGAGLAGGDWERIEALIARCLVECDVTVYTL
jgi:O-acetyl-ADP-ribose deacetylase (regulator of RNase III)